MRSREVVEGKQIILVLYEAFHGLGILFSKGFDEEVESLERVLASGGKILVVEHILGFRLEHLGELVQNVPGLVEPAPLDTRLGPDFRGGGLEDRLS